ncbi:MAG: NADH:quinone oxidoreductase, partial [Methylosarcina sp.]
MDNYISVWEESAGFPLLTSLTVVPLISAIAILISSTTITTVRCAFAGTLLNTLLSLYLLFVFDSEMNGIQLFERMEFAGVTYCVGADGANILFIPLTAVLALMALVYTLITRHAADRLFIACLLGYEGILIGAFSALNVMQFWLWSVMELLPIIVLTLHAGTGQQKRWVIDRVLQYWISGLLMTLTGFLLLAFGLIESEHPLTFDWLTLKQNNAYLHD